MVDYRGPIACRFPHINEQKTILPWLPVPEHGTGLGMLCLPTWSFKSLSQTRTNRDDDDDDDEDGDDDDDDGAARCEMRDARTTMGLAYMTHVSAPVKAPSYSNGRLLTAT